MNSRKQIVFHARFITYFLVLVTFITGSCKKESQFTKEERVDQFRAWYTAYTGGKPQDMAIFFSENQFARTRSDQQNRELPILLDWEHANVYSVNDSIITEVPVESAKMLAVAFQNEDKDVDKRNPASSIKLVFIRNGAGITASFMTTIAKKSYIRDHEGAILRTTLKHREPSFTGTVIFNTLDGALAGGTIYSDGKPKRIITKASRQTKGMSTKNAHAEECGEGVTIDWYLIDCYSVDGVTIACFETYLYSTTYDSCPYGGDGGGGGTNQCASDAQLLFSDMEWVANESSSESAAPDYNFNGYEYLEPKSWIVAHSQSYFASIKSVEQAKIRKVGPHFEYVSIVHDKLYFQGGNAGLTYKVDNAVTATPYVSQDKKIARMSLDGSVPVTVECGFSIAVGHIPISNKSKTWQLP